MAPTWLALVVALQAGAEAPSPPSPEKPPPSSPRSTFDGATRFPRAVLDRFPTARNVWVVLESQQPGVVTDRIDVGGLRALTPGRLGGRGPSWTQNAYVFDGLDVTDPYGGDRPLVHPDFDVVDELAVSTAVHPAAVAVPGIELALTPRQGSDRFRGAGQLYYAGAGTQADNVPPAKRRLGVRSPERFGRDLDANLHLGGPLFGGGARYFLSLSARDQAIHPHDVDSTVEPRLLSAFGRATKSLGSHSFSLLGARQSSRNPHLGASARVPPESTVDSRGSAWLAQLSDALALGDALRLDGRLGLVREDSRGRFQADALRQSGLELFRGMRSGAAPFAEDAARTRLGFGATLSGTAETRALSFGARARHAFRGGFAWDESWSHRSLSARDEVHLEFFEGRPYAVHLLDTPAATAQRLRNLALFAEDRVELSSRLSLDLGLRLGSASGGPRGAPSAIRWTTWSPRLGVAAAPLGERLTLRATFARYPHRLLGRYVEHADPALPGGTRRLWGDANGDRQYQPGEEGDVLRRYGGAVTRVDPELEPPVTREVTVGADLRLGGALLSATALDRRDTDLIETINEGVPFSAYSPLALSDAGGDRTAGTADDRVLTVYEQARETLGQDAFLLTNPRGFRTSYQGVEVAARTDDPGARLFVRFSASAFRIVGMASQEAEAQEYDPGVLGPLFDDPNSLIEADNRLFFDRAYLVKLAVAYRLPWGFEAGGVAKYYDGLPFGRKLVVTGLAQGPFYVFAAPRGNRASGTNGHRVEYNATLDLGIEKRIPLGRSALRLRLDAFNVLNASNNTREADLSGPTFNDRVPLEIQAPRVLRVGVRCEF